MPDIEELSHVRAQFHSVQQSEGFRLLLALVNQRVHEAEADLASCSPDDLVMCQSRLRAWREVGEALGTQDGGGYIQDFLGLLIDKKPSKPSYASHSLRVPGNR